jgi:predicted phage terminase large subunit-like protein
MGASAVSIDAESLREERLRRERDWYLSEEGFLDFVRDSGAAPDAEFQPHGKLAPSLLKWNGKPDPENPKIINYTYKMQLWPRGSFKSAVFNVGMCAWLIANNPSIRILVASETAKQAREFVAKCMQIIDSEWYRERFGVHRGKRWKEGTGSFTSALRTRTEIKEPTLLATGVGEVRTGMHWDFALCDDVVSQENTKTPESIEGTFSWLGETLAQLDPGCKLMLIGTLHHFSDLYCKIQSDPEMRKLFEFSIFAWSDPIVDPRGNEPAELFFPGRLTRQFVAQRRALLPSRLYACFYENRPMTGEQQLFKPEYFHVLEDEDIPTHVWTYIFTDFAFIAEEKKKGRADRTAFWVVSLDCNRYAYVRDFYVGRWKPSDSVRIVCDLWDRYQGLNLRAIVLEESAHKELLSSLFEEIRRNTFVHPKIVTIQGRNQEVKDMRIEAIEPAFREGKIYFSRSVQQAHRKWKPLIDEMTQWPFSAHDDIPDAISDLHKRDKEGKYYCPAPGAGWRMAPNAPYQPPMVDGRFNPNAGYPAREFIKRDQPKSTSWQGLSNEGQGPNQSIFSRQQRPPTRWGKFS